MAHLIKGDTITAAWISATDHLRLHGREAYDLVTEIADPTPGRADEAMISEVDALLRRKGYATVGTVANTIFPAQLARTARDRAHLYERYGAIYPRVRRTLRKNGKGTYFGRLIDFPLQQDPVRANQIETIIADLKAQLARREHGQGALGSVYEAQIFAPGKDRLPIGFPCMSSLSFQLDGDDLRLTSTYRNQYYIQKALGNFTGLAQLHRFVADAAGVRQGPLTIHAFHAQIDPDVAGRDVAALLSAIRAISCDPIADESAA